MLTSAVFQYALLDARRIMATDQPAEESTRAVQVACDTEVSGCVFVMRTVADDRDRLVEIARDNVREQHGKEYSLEEIEQRHVEEIEI